MFCQLYALIYINELTSTQTPYEILKNCSLFKCHGIARTEATKEPLFIIIVQSQFAFETENVLKDYQDVMKQLNIFYSQVVDFVRDNTEGYFDKLIPKPLVFDDVIDQMKANGYYQHLN
ncbi:hypothetical protein DBR11_19500 [Pedobacter sp. HMWF019]|nr:hypothetical protein DBR11_19500 [Pedobacter sp. HMWF019]